ncbi:MAG TPA: substrate-binding domain-containing protein [Casimicrobiaceae bacterium]|nr:substrate-binding domain-containing protein [Casimicrobiaceae bacterium]
MATRRVLAELAQSYGRFSGQGVAVESVGGVDAVRRIEAGEAFDFAVLSRHAIEQLAATGHVDRESPMDFARSRIAVAVPTGARRPDIATAQGVRDAVLAAPSIGYSTGPSGRHLRRLFEDWGVAQAIAARTVEASPGVPVAALIARGEVTLGFQQLSELIGEPGIDVVGTLPEEIGEITVFAGAVCTSARHAGAARAVLDFLASPATDAVKRRHGMEP